MQIRHCSQILRPFAKLWFVALFLALAAGCNSNRGPEAPIAGTGAPADKPAAGITLADPISLVKKKLSEDLEQAVNLVLTASNTDGVWTFLAGRPTSLDGSGIDYTKTQYAEDWSEGYFDDRFVALVKTSAAGNNHNLVAYDLGSTDAPFVDWPDKYGVPATIVLLD